MLTQRRLRFLSQGVPLPVHVSLTTCRPLSKGRLTNRSSDRRIQMWHDGKRIQYRQMHHCNDIRHHLFAVQGVEHEIDEDSVLFVSAQRDEAEGVGR